MRICAGPGDRFEVEDIVAMHEDVWVKVRVGVRACASVRAHVVLPCVHARMGAACTCGPVLEAEGAGVWGALQRRLSSFAQWAATLPHLHGDWARPCATSGTRLAPAPHLHGNWARPCATSGTGLLPDISAPGSPLPDLHRDWAHSWHIWDRAHSWHICTGARLGTAPSVGIQVVGLDDGKLSLSIKFVSQSDGKDLDPMNGRTRTQAMALRYWRVLTRC